MSIHRNRLWVLSFVVLSVFMFVLLEGGSFFITRFFQHNLILTPSSFVSGLENEWLERYYKTTFDPVLGWRPKAKSSAAKKNSAGNDWSFKIDEFGARENPKFESSRSPYIATFGDSWTFGDEVNNDETWQSYLSDMLGSYVANYGVGGFGTDQAFLRFTEELKAGLSPVYAVLAIFEENYKRVLNRFRPFYFPGTGVKLGFKPRAYLDRSGELAFLDSELKSPIYERARLAELIEAARANDYWAEFNPWFEFPYSFNLFRAARINFCARTSDPSYCQSAKRPTWESPEVRPLMKALINEFVQTAESRNIRPVVLFLTHRKRGSYFSFAGELRNMYDEKDVIIIDIAEAGFELSKFRILPNSGHASPQGNKLIAKHIAQYFSAGK